MQPYLRQAAYDTLKINATIVPVVAHNFSSNLNQEINYTSK
jgi:hypothetical protein